MHVCGIHASYSHSLTICFIVRESGFILGILMIIVVTLLTYAPLSSVHALLPILCADSCEQVPFSRDNGFVWCESG